MGAPKPATLLRSLGVDAVDAQDVKYRIIVGEPTVSDYGIAYQCVSGAAIPNGTVFAVPGLSGQWTYAGDNERRDGLYYGSIS